MNTGSNKVNNSIISANQSESFGDISIIKYIKCSIPVYRTGLNTCIIQSDTITVAKKTKIKGKENCFKNA